MSDALAQLDDLQHAARQAEEFRARAAGYREAAAVEAHPVRRQNFAEAAAHYEGEAKALAPKESRLRRAVAALERALADEP